MLSSSYYGRDTTSKYVNLNTKNANNCFNFTLKYN